MWRRLAAPRIDLAKVTLLKVPYLIFKDGPKAIAGGGSASVGSARKTAAAQASRLTRRPSPQGSVVRVCLGINLRISSTPEPSPSLDKIELVDCATAGGTLRITFFFRELIVSSYYHRLETGFKRMLYNSARWCTRANIYLSVVTSRRNTSRMNFLPIPNQNYKPQSAYTEPLLQAAKSHDCLKHHLIEL